MERLQRLLVLSTLIFSATSREQIAYLVTEALNSLLDTDSSLLIDFSDGSRRLFGKLEGHPVSEYTAEKIIDFLLAPDSLDIISGHSLLAIKNVCPAGEASNIHLNGGFVIPLKTHTNFYGVLII